MPKLNLDLREAESRKPLEDDKYRWRVLSISAPKSGPKAKYVEMVAEVSEGEYEGRKVYHNMPISGKGAGIFVDFWNKIMGTEYDVDDLEELDLDTDEAVGQEFIGTTKQEEYPEGSGQFNHKLAQIYALTA